MFSSYSHSFSSFSFSALVMMLTIPTASKATPAAAAAPNALAAVVDARRAELRSAGQATVHAFANALSSLAQAGASSEIKTKAMVAIKQVGFLLLSPIFYSGGRS